MSNQKPFSRDYKPLPLLTAANSRYLLFIENGSKSYRAALMLLEKNGRPLVSKRIMCADGMWRDMFFCGYKVAKELHKRAKELRNPNEDHDYMIFEKPQSGPANLIESYGRYKLAELEERKVIGESFIPSTSS